jgi:hypothetical protein
MDQKTPEGASSEASAESPPTMPAEAVPAPPPAAPPPVGWNAAVPAQAPGGRVTGLAKIASGILIVVGLLITVFGLLLVGGGALLGTYGQSDLPGLAGPFGALFAGIGVVVIILGVIEVLAGIGSWRGSGAGRVVGIIYGVLGALGGISGLSSGDSGGSLGSIVTLVLFGYVAVVLLFRWKAPVTA